MQLRYYQEEAVQSIFDYFNRGNTGNPVIAMPTGTGKSLVIGGFIQRAAYYFPRTRFIVATHVKELIQQNANKLTTMWRDAPLGIYSAGLKQRDIAMPIIFGGIASMISKPSAFGWRDLMLIDECHLLNPKSSTMYARFIAELKQVNPAMRVIGLSATPWRTGQGRVTEGGVFTDTAYDITGFKAFNRLVHEGFIAPLIPKRTTLELDVSNVGMSQGDYNNAELIAAVDKDDVTYKALIESCQLGADRRSWVAFCAGVHHAETAAQILQSFGIAAAAIHSNLTGAERDARIAAFKRGELRCLCTNNMLTTGFDHPPIDMIIMLRPTMSVGLWVQMLGRGTRPSPETGKEDCLVLDFAKNTPRLGPINDPNIPKTRKGGKPGITPVRLCPACGVYNHASARFCDYCEFEFGRTIKIIESAGSDELIRSDLPVIETIPVQFITYTPHQKAGSPPCMMITYGCGSRQFKEFVMLEHGAYAAKKSRDWWRERHNDEPPATTAEALQRQAELKRPTHIRVWTNTKHPKVMGYEYGN